MFYLAAFTKTFGPLAEKAIGPKRLIHTLAQQLDEHEANADQSMAESIRDYATRQESGRKYGFAFRASFSEAARVQLYLAQAEAVRLVLGHALVYLCTKEERKAFLSAAVAFRKAASETRSTSDRG